METTLKQRWTRFAEEDLGTFVTCSALFTVFQTGKEFYDLQDKLLPVTQRLAVAARRTGPKVPLLVCSAAVGMAGMKLSIAAVSHYRQDFSRDNVLMAFPVCGALLNVHRGPRAMTKGALGLAALGYGADYVFGIYHRMKFEDALREHEKEQAMLHHYQTSTPLDSKLEIESFVASSRQW
ncbi:Protein Kinase [Phytophthora palmivora]|uniref:Protein Kinase n=1 Tax=Phytophthora palmivora TaxID=4796 RepID=A0A2P4XS73_9STRA|nr:Protein Kinase [Phytophthora palmivora]